MKVNFEKTITPCVSNDVTLWHAAHGYIWNVREVSGRYIGVFFATLLCGEGAVVHFSTVPDIRISSSTIAQAFCKAKRLFPSLGVVFATIPQEKASLISLACRLGFRKTSVMYEREQQGNIILLQYFSSQ